MRIFCILHPFLMGLMNTRTRILVKTSTERTAIASWGPVHRAVLGNPPTHSHHLALPNCIITALRGVPRLQITVYDAPGCGAGPRRGGRCRISVCERRGLFSLIQYVWRRVGGTSDDTQTLVGIEITVQATKITVVFKSWHLTPNRGSGTMTRDLCLP